MWERFLKPSNKSWHWRGLARAGRCNRKHSNLFESHWEGLWLIKALNVMVQVNIFLTLNQLMIDCSDVGDISYGSYIRQEQTCLQDFATVCNSNFYYLSFGAMALVSLVVICGCESNNHIWQSWKNSTLLKQSKKKQKKNIFEFWTTRWSWQNWACLPEWKFTKKKDIKPNICFFVTMAGWQLWLAGSKYLL